MNTKDLMSALEAWATATVPELGSYDHAPEQIDQALPLVIAEPTRDAVVQGEREGGMFSQMQQRKARVWQCRLLLMVSPDPPWTASQALYDMVDTLGAALRRDGTLGQRVPYALPEYQADYEPAEVEWPDGSVARTVRFSLTVAEQVSPT